MRKSSKRKFVSTKSYGFTMEQTPLNNRLYRGLICLLKGILVFSATYGTIAGLLSAFSIEYAKPVVFIILLFLSFCLSGLHYNRIVFNCGYPIIFVIFTWSIVRFRSLANSGFQTFVSTLYEYYSSHFQLSSLREVTVSNTDRYLTITVAAIYVGFALALLLNIAISTYMNVFLTLLLTAPILQLCIYINLYPSPFYFIPLIFSYIAVGILGSFRHHSIPTQKKEFLTFASFHKNKTNYHVYRANGKVLLQATLVFALATFLFMICFYPLALRSVRANSAKNKVKETTDEYVKTFVQSGLSGFFNRYTSTGGLSNGRLGGVSSVRPDYQTDLIVTFAPYSYETIYLKAFVGTDYLGNSWSNNRPDPLSYASSFYNTQKKQQAYVEFFNTLELRRLEHYKESGGLYVMDGKMEIVNVDANEEYLYEPYYSYSPQYSISANDLFERDITSSLSAPSHSLRGGRNTYYYCPPILQMEELIYPDTDAYSKSLAVTSDELSYLTTYRDYCFSTYTYVPDNLKKPIQDVVEQIGSCSGTFDIINGITNYFEKEYRYSMSPGATPMRADFISYFLTDQNQGYCAHFASASTMIFRYMGIPARYVEGYVIPVSSVSEATRVDKDYSEYLTGTSPLGETGVVEVEITDANAHAWVEIYSDGFGWIPVEVTPPSDEEETDYSDFFLVFSNLFSIAPEQNQENTQDVTVNLTQTNRFLAGTSHLLTPFIILLLILLLAKPCYYFILRTLSYLEMKFAYHKGDYATVASYHYKRLFFLLLRRGKLTCTPCIGKHPTYLEKQNFFASHAPQKVTSLLEKYGNSTRFLYLLEKALYSLNGISKDEIDELLKLKKTFVQNLRHDSKN